MFSLTARYKTDLGASPQVPVQDELFFDPGASCRNLRVFTTSLFSGPRGSDVGNVHKPGTTNPRRYPHRFVLPARLDGCASEVYGRASEVYGCASEDRRERDSRIFCALNRMEAAVRKASRKSVGQI